MADLQLDSNQDFQLKEITPGDFDFELTDQIQALIIQGFSTPIQSRKAYVLDASQGLFILDQELGNPLYELISEPFSLEWIQEARQSLQVLFNQLELPIELLELTTNWVKEGVEIQLTYRDSIQTNQTQILLPL